MQVEGTAEVTLCASNILMDVDAVVSSNLRDDLLVGCEDLSRLKIIPSNFPHQAVPAITILRSMKEKLLAVRYGTLGVGLKTKFIEA